MYKQFTWRILLSIVSYFIKSLLIYEFISTPRYVIYTVIIKDILFLISFLLRKLYLLFMSN